MRQNGYMHFVTQGARGPAPVEKLQAKKKIDDGWYNVYHQRMVETRAQRTIFEKIWSRHGVAEGPGGHVLLLYRPPPAARRLDQRLRVAGEERASGAAATNSRLEDLRAAARVVKGRRAMVPAWIVPGSGLVKRAAEAEGLDRVFVEAGFEWREAGCSMCVGMNGETAREGERVASTSNRNFEGRQGKGARTHLMSPAMAAAAAVMGRLTDVRTLGA